MRTLQELNLKIWYRLLKVIYIFLFFIIFIFGIFLLYEEVGFKQVNNDKGDIICYSPEDRKFKNNSGHITLPLKEYINPSELYGEHINNKDSYEWFLKYRTYFASKIASHCVDSVNGNNKRNINEIQEWDIVFIQQNYESRFGDNGVNFTKDDIDNPDSDEKIEVLKQKKDEFGLELEKLSEDKDVFKLFDYSIRMFEIELKYSYNKFIISSLIFIFIFISIFELFRRIFYYIVLGTLFPKKKENA